MKTYHQRVVETYQLQERSQRELLEILQRLCPGYWVLGILAVPIRKNDSVEMGYRVEVSNGDDNVTIEGKNLGAAIARVVACLLDGSVFPLGGNGGTYIAEQDRTKDADEVSSEDVRVHADNAKHWMDRALAYESRLEENDRAVLLFLGAAERAADCLDVASPDTPKTSEAWKFLRDGIAEFKRKTQ